MKLRDKKRIDYSVDITPLVDVVFLMLIFFMVSTSFDVASSLKIDLPTSKTSAQEMDVKQVTVSIDAKGQLSVQNEVVEDGMLRSRILNFTKGDANMPVTIRADADARHKRVVLVLDTLRDLGISKVGIATVPTGEGEH